MLKITTFFQNRITTANLIFRDLENKGTNIIYYPELGTIGIDFINKYRKKNYWDYVVIPQAFMFLSHKILTNNYYKDFKKNIPMIRIQRKFIKVNNDAKSVVVDLSPLTSAFTSMSKSRSKKQTMDEFFGLVEQLAVDSKMTSKTSYLLIDNVIGTEKEMVESIMYIARLSGNKLRVKGIEGILLYGSKKYWPLTTKEKDKDGDYFKLNINILTRYMKEVHGEEIQDEESPEEAIAVTKETVRALYKIHSDSINSKSSTAGIAGAAKTTSDINENPLEIIKNEVQGNQYLKGKSFEEKLSNLFKENKANKEANDTKDTKADKKARETSKIVQNISRDLLELNKQHNGTIELNENTVLNSRKSFYNPFKIIGYKDFSAYNKQETEFGENLDQSIFDLIKSISADKEAGIKVLSIKTEITDTNMDRFKTYKIKIQHKDFGYDKPYTVSFHVPTPSKGKYLKLRGNDWIMINQFFPKPVIKVSPETVRLYTHYGTLSVFIKTHAFNEDYDAKEFIKDLSDKMRRTKKLNKPAEPLTTEERQHIIDKYNLPENINSDVLTNLEIK